MGKKLSSRTAEEEDDDGSCGLLFPYLGYYYY